LPSITHFASSHETLSAAEATLAKRKAARISSVGYKLRDGSFFYHEHSHSAGQPRNVTP
jgi:hypothetical protein